MKRLKNEDDWHLFGASIVVWDTADFTATAFKIFRMPIIKTAVSVFIRQRNNTFTAFILAILFA